MTREEEINQMALEYAKVMLGDECLPYDGPYTDCITDVTYGAKWADENHKKGMVSLDKVCEWIKEHMNEFCMEAAEECMISWLRKAMEE